MLSFKLAGHNGIPHDEYRTILFEMGFTETDENQVDYYIYTQDSVTPADYKTCCRLKSVVDSKSISNVANKLLLSQTMGKYMAREYPLNRVLRAGRVSVYDVILFKPVGPMAFGGHGIQILTKGAKPTFEPQYKYVACQYIKDLMTFQGKKFHLRVYLFVSTWGRWELYPKYRIITAGLPYIKGDWQDKRIHDTHLESTDEDYFFARDQDLYLEKTDKKIRHICKALAKNVQAGSYPESTAAYEMLGLDFLVKTSGTPVLLEVNNNAGIKCVHEWNWFKKDILELEMSFVREYFEL